MLEKAAGALRGGMAKAMVAVSLAVGSGLSFAAAGDGTIDTSGVVTTITGSIDNVTAIGGAVLGVIVAAMVYKWVRRAF